MRSCVYVWITLFLCAMSFRAISRSGTFFHSVLLPHAHPISPGIEVRTTRCKRSYSLSPHHIFGQCPHAPSLTSEVQTDKKPLHEWLISSCHSCRSPSLPKSISGPLSYLSALPTSCTPFQSLTVRVPGPLPHLTVPSV